MPNIKAAIKWTRQTEKRTQRNLAAKTRLKTLFKRGKTDPATAPSVESAYDKAAGKGVIHPNKAARKKSRLAKALAAAKQGAGASAAEKPARGRAKTK